MDEGGQMKIDQGWKDIWNNKYSKYKDHKHLHVQDGFDDLSYGQWQKLTSFFLNKILIKNTDEILEVGCGSGAFAKQIKSYKTIKGVDYSAEAIESIRCNIPDGEFYVSEANLLPFEVKSFDKVICFSVFFYFSSYTYASDVLDEMLRVLKPNGQIFIGEINDIEKEQTAIILRKESGEKRKNRAVSTIDADHLYYSFDFFRDFAFKNNLDIELISENVPDLDFYESSSYRSSILLKRSSHI
jgi:ubiquinone/menaquinone biosynthesis C-methylase UbiE